MNVLVDYHHISLLRSIYILFKERFGFNLYVPKGWDWHYQGSLYSSYSAIVGNSFVNPITDAGYIKRYLPELNVSSFEKFKSDYYDIVVCTLLENYVSWKALIKQYNLKCKLIFQIGNNIPLWAQPYTFENVLSSSWPCYLKADCKNKIFYHQEFDTKKFTQDLNCNKKSIANMQHYMQRSDLFYNLEKSMIDYKFYAHGAGNRDGSLPAAEDTISSFVKSIGFVFHCKQVDEGYGHNIHNAFACGKPVITDSSYMGVNWDTFIGNTASLMFEDRKTIIDIHNKSEQEIEKCIREITDNYTEVSNYIFNKFKTVCNFDEEFLNIKKFIENLV